MYHLGICYGHNATVAVIKDGRLVFCQSEERLNRIKNSTGFPSQTIEYVYGNLCKPEEVVSATLFQKTVYGYLHLKNHGFKPYQYGHYLDPAIVGGGTKHRLADSTLGSWLSRARISLNERRKALQHEAKAYFSRELRLDASRITEMDHHLSHAYSVLPNVREWGKALIFTLDGQGDWNCATVNEVEDGKLKVLQRTNDHHSLGYYYSAVTALLGMKAGEHEFKVMGLAPYARREYYSPLVERLNQLLDVDDEGRWVSTVTPRGIQDALDRIFRYQRFDNVAGAIQALTEQLILKWVHHWIRKTGIGNIGVSGGVFMNVKACQRLAESELVERLFVMPSAADESTAIGCAVWGSEQAQTQVMPLRDLYLGVEFTDGEVEQALRETKAHDRYAIVETDNINQRVAQLLAENHIVARCSGRMEFGARALGNRSILANPSRFENLHRINDAIKSRDFWMPFTPSILAEDMERYIVNPKGIHAPYMCITFDTTPDARRDLIAAIHPRDFTARPQSVSPDWNPDYHELLTRFKSLTGIGGVLNTSFNLHGEPNVCSPQDAIRTVDQSGLQYLVMGRFLLEKKVGARARPN
jgi:carbamoyltransferase